MGTGVSGAVAGKLSGASDRKVSGADPAGRAKTAGEAAGKAAGVGVHLTAGETSGNISVVCFGKYHLGKHQETYLLCRIQKVPCWETSGKDMWSGIQKVPAGETCLGRYRLGKHPEMYLVRVSENTFRERSGNLIAC
jgi:hypothetical protein